MALDRLLVQGVDLEGLRRSAHRDDLLGHALNLAERAAGEEYFRAFAREGPSDGATDGPAGTVNDRCLVLEKHSLSFHLAFEAGRRLVCRHAAVRAVETLGAGEIHRRGTIGRN